MKQQWSEVELNTHWALDHSEHTLIKQRTEHSQLGFAILLKYFQLESHFPDRRNTVPKAVVVFIAEQLGIDSHVWGSTKIRGELNR